MDREVDGRHRIRVAERGMTAGGGAGHRRDHRTVDRPTPRRIHPWPSAVPIDDAALGEAVVPVVEERQRWPVQTTVRRVSRPVELAAPGGRSSRRWATAGETRCHGHRLALLQETSRARHQRAAGSDDLGGDHRRTRFARDSAP